MFISVSLFYFFIFIWKLLHTVAEFSSSSDPTATLDFPASLAVRRNYWVEFQSVNCEKWRASSLRQGGTCGVFRREQKAENISNLRNYKAQVSLLLSTCPYSKLMILLLQTKKKGIKPSGEMEVWIMQQSQIFSL